MSRISSKPTAIVCGVPVDAPFERIAGGLYRKQLIYAGDFRLPRGGSFSADRALIDHWVSQHAALSAVGFKPPLPLEHTENPEANRGEVVKLEAGTDALGRYSLFGVVKFSDAEAEKLATRTNVSIFSPSYFDYAGQRWRQPIKHVALTSYPVVPGLESFRAIVASLTTTGSTSTMLDWSPIAGLLDLPEGVELNDDNAIELIAVSLKTLKDAADANAKKPEPPKPEPPKPGDSKPGEPSKPAEPPKPPIAASMLGILRDNRKMKLDALQTSGRLTKAARTELEKAHLGDGSLALSLGGTDDGFDRMISVLAANDPCVPMKERTPGQTVALSNPASGPAELSTVAYARQLAEQAKARK